MNKPINSRLIILFVAFAFYVAAIVLQKKLPANDEAFNFENSTRLIERFENEKTSVLNQINELYWTRSFRPNLLNPVGTLLMEVTGSDFKLTQLILTVSEFLLFALALTYLFGHLAAPSISRYLVGVILFIPWVFHGLTIFSSEGLGLVFFAWSIIFILKVDFKNFEAASNRRYLTLSSIMAGLMIAAKPVEGVLIFLPLIGLLSVIEISFKKTALVFLGTTAALMYPILYCYQIYTNEILPDNTSSALWVVGLVGILCISAVVGTLFRSLINSFILIIPCSFLAFFWFGPFSFVTLQWILDASIGSIARDTGGRENLSIFTFLLYAFNSLFGYVTIFILIYYSCFRKVWKKNDFILLFCFSVPLIAGALSYNNDLRYYMYTGLGYILIIFSGDVRSPIFLPEKIVKIEPHVFRVFLFLCFAHTASVFQFSKPLPLMNKPAFGLWPNNVFLEKDITEERIKILAENFDFQNRSNFCLLQMPSTNENFQIDPWISTILLRKEGYKIHILRPVPHNLSSLEERFDQRVKDVCCYTAIFPLTFDHSKPTHSLNDVGEWFLTLYKKNNMAATGFVFDRKLNIPPYGTDYDMLVFKNSRTLACSNDPH